MNEHILGFGASHIVCHFIFFHRLSIRRIVQFTSILMCIKKKHSKITHGVITMHKATKTQRMLAAGRDPDAIDRWYTTGVCDNGSHGRVRLLKFLQQAVQIGVDIIPFMLLFKSL